MTTSSAVRPSGTSVVLLALAGAVQLSVSPAELAAQSLDCDRNTVHCVDARAGRAEFESIQEAVDVARPGDEVVVFPGRYAGFRVENGGRRGRRIAVLAMAGAIVNRPEAGSDHGIYLANVSYVTVGGFEIDGRGDIYTPTGSSPRATVRGGSTRARRRISLACANG